MTREGIDRLIAEYTTKTSIRSEDDLVLEWERLGLDQYGWDHNDRAHEIFQSRLPTPDLRPALD